MLSNFFLTRVSHCVKKFLIVSFRYGRGVFLAFAFIPDRVFSFSKERAVFLRVQFILTRFSTWWMLPEMGLSSSLTLGASAKRVKETPIAAGGAEIKVLALEVIADPPSVFWRMAAKKPWPETSKNDLETCP